MCLVDISAREFPLFFSLTKGYENIVSIRIGKHETRRIPHVCVIVENNRVCSCGMPVSFCFVKLTLDQLSLVMMWKS